jgi:CheY-like chemotaxis protein
MTYKVLIVDDSKLARMSIARLLNALQPSWSRVEAANAEEAIACYTREGADLVLLDLNMPGRDGLALATDLRARDAALSLAIISANNQDAILTRGRAIGAAFLLKPLTREALAEFLSTMPPRLNTAS